MMIGFVARSVEFLSKGVRKTHFDSTCDPYFAPICIAWRGPPYRGYFISKLPYGFYYTSAW